MNCVNGCHGTISVDVFPYAADSISRCVGEWIHYGRSTADSRRDSDWRREMFLLLRLSHIYWSYPGRYIFGHLFLSNCCIQIDCVKATHCLHSLALSLKLYLLQNYFVFLWLLIWSVCSLFIEHILTRSAR